MLSRIGEIAPGSYGFAWYLDDEGHYSWRVHTLVRGVFTQRGGPWFWPMIPAVEGYGPLAPGSLASEQ
jgi:hypothetical protein